MVGYRNGLWVTTGIQGVNCVCEKMQNFERFDNYHFFFKIRL